MPSAATRIRPEMITLSEVSPKNEDHTGITSTWNLKYGRSAPIHKTETESGTWRIDRCLDSEFGVSRCKLVYTEYINNEVLLYSTPRQEHSHPVISHKAQEHGKQCYITESLCCVQLITQRTDQPYVNKKINSKKKQTDHIDPLTCPAAAAASRPRCCCLQQLAFRLTRIHIPHICSFI